MYSWKKRNLCLKIFLLSFRISKQNWIFKIKSNSHFKRWYSFADFDFSADVIWQFTHFMCDFLIVRVKYYLCTKFYVYMNSLSKVIEGGWIQSLALSFVILKNLLKVLTKIRKQPPRPIMKYLFGGGTFLEISYLFDNIWNKLFFKKISCMFPIRADCSTTGCDNILAKYLKMFCRRLYKSDMPHHQFIDQS